MDGNFHFKPKKIKKKPHVGRYCSSSGIPIGNRLSLVSILDSNFYLFEKKKILPIITEYACE